LSYRRNKLHPQILTDHTPILKRALAKSVFNLTTASQLFQEN